MIDWYRMPWKKNLVVPLMISMSRSTTKITAGNIIELSISSFSNCFIKTILLVLRHVFYPFPPKDQERPQLKLHQTMAEKNPLLRMATKRI
ncbi:hypothetical protein E2986_11710 [Frieseomelitta varia]|uniref:Uncharacterized protein n=1 Tax=Frieseomelitta varia TaxID=561572 RepID=A0A833RQ62_9HYME|nr:hypothetical protein E2986_11710 [Frieseomelitta varia]